MIRPSKRWSTAWATLNILVILATVVTAITFLRARVGAGAFVFLSLSAVLSVASVVTTRQLLKLARRNFDRELQVGVLYRKPAWIGFAENMSVLSVGAALEGVASLSHLPWIGLGIGTIAVLLFAVAYGHESVMPSRDLLFEEMGLRVGVGDGTFLISWENVLRAEPQGSVPYQMVAISLRDNWSVIETAQPNTEVMRGRVTGLFSEDARGGRLVLPAWTGGLDAARLAREIARKSLQTN